MTFTKDRALALAEKALKDLSKGIASRDKKEPLKTLKMIEGFTSLVVIIMDQVDKEPVKSKKRKYNKTKVAPVPLVEAEPTKPTDQSGPSLA